MKSEIPTRPFGRTAERISILGLGGYHVGLPRTDRAAVRLIHDGDNVRGGWHRGNHPRGERRAGAIPGVGVVQLPTCGISIRPFP